MGTTAAAVRYAEALYELAHEQGRVDAVLEDVAALKAAFQRDLDGWRKLQHPRIEPREKEALLRDRFFSGLDPLVQNTALFLVRRRREELFEAFFRAYLDVHDARMGILRVAVESASPLDARATSDLEAKLSAATGKKVALEAKVSPEILGGLRLRIGSRLVDGSVQRRLERIERGLLEAPLTKI